MLGFEKEWQEIEARLTNRNNGEVHTNTLTKALFREGVMHYKREEIPLSVKTKGATTLECCNLLGHFKHRVYRKHLCLFLCASVRKSSPQKHLTPGCGNSRSYHS